LPDSGKTSAKAEVIPMAISPGILVVEPDPLARLGLEYFLAREGFPAHGAASLDEARKNMAGATVVFLELDLPDGNGADLFREIRAAALPIRVAIMSAKPPAATAAQTAGCDAYFEKPITRFKLDRMLAWLKALPPIAPSP
jgi:DNA-binding response OmpR family regulator